jgi:hypothetical protein
VISVDHEINPRDAEAGNGLLVVSALCGIPPTCPVIIHSSDEYASRDMVRMLKDAGWPVATVIPGSGLAWIEKEWAGKVFKYRDRGWIKL